MVQQPKPTQHGLGAARAGLPPAVGGGGGADGRKPRLDLSDARWISSTTGPGDVQIAFVDGYVAMRDARDPDGPALVFTPAEWRAFVLGARDGEFDLA